MVKAQGLCAPHAEFKFPRYAGPKLLHTVGGNNANLNSRTVQSLQTSTLCFVSIVNKAGNVKMVSSMLPAMLAVLISDVLIL